MAAPQGFKAVLRANPGPLLILPEAGRGTVAAMNAIGRFSVFIVIIGDTLRLARLQVRGWIRDSLQGGVRTPR